VGALGQQGVADAGDGLAAQHARDEGTGVDKSVQVDAGGDAQAVQQVDHVFGGDVAGRALGIGAAAQAGDAGVEDVNAQRQAGVDVGERLAVGVVEVAAELGQRARA
jgi:hypothetical protein